MGRGKTPRKRGSFQFLEGAKKPMTEKEPSPWKDLGDAGTMGIELVVSVLLFAGIGFWLDGRFGTSPILTIIGGVLGFAAGLRRVYVLLVKKPEDQ